MNYNDVETKYINNPYDKVYWFKNINALAKDAVIVKNTSAKAGAFPKWGDIYMADGDKWYKADGTELSYYTITVTLGSNTTVTIVDEYANSYVSGDRVKSGATLTITATANAGYNLTTFTVNAVDKLSSNPATHTVSGNVAIVTAATGA